MRYLFMCLMFMSSAGYANQLQSQNTSTSAQNTSTPSNANANPTTSTGSQIVTVIVPPAPPPPKPVVVVVRKTVYRTKKKVVHETNPNRVQLLVGASRTKQDITTDACGCAMSATRVYQPDIGAQYLRDFGGFTGSVMATQNQAIYIGVGFNW